MLCLINFLSLPLNAAEAVAVIVRALREYATCRTKNVALYGAWAILYVAWSDRAIQQRFVAAGARAVLEAIIADPASSEQAKETAREALKKLE